MEMSTAPTTLTRALVMLPSVEPRLPPGAPRPVPVATAVRGAAVRPRAAIRLRRGDHAGWAEQVIALLRRRATS